MHWNNIPEENTLVATLLTEWSARYQLLEGQFGHIYAYTICCPMPITLQRKPAVGHGIQYGHNLYLIIGG